MKKNIIISTLILLTFTVQLSAQEAKLIIHGTIEYERSNNMYALIKKEIGDDEVSKLRFEEYKKRFPQFKRTKSILQFTDKESLFTPYKDTFVSDDFFGSNSAANQINTTYINYATQNKISKKQIYEDIFLIKDSLKTVNWKITNETREIAGFSCRRANAIIMDSVYVVAFYTDQIPVSGGPESFGGLPGMILGIALPHENVTWFAKKVIETTVNQSKLTPPVKGKVIDHNGLKKVINDVLKATSGNYYIPLWPFEL